MARDQYLDKVYRNLEKRSESQLIDIVLIHPHLKGTQSDADKLKIQAAVNIRKIFKKKLKNDGFEVSETDINDQVYTKLRCSFKRLCIEAEKTNLQMPLLGMTYPQEIQTNICSKFIYNKFVTEKTVYPKSARFMVERIHLFENYKDPRRFFRQSVRTLLVNNILINMNIREFVLKNDITVLEDDGSMYSTDTESNSGKEKRLENILNFPYMKKLGVYTDHLILHEPSDASTFNEEQPDRTFNDEIREIQDVKKEDQRKVLNDEWTAFFKFQPLTKIRTYFGEKIAFYFTWSGLLMTSLWVPMILGLIIFIYGIVRRITQTLAIFNGACDNDVTPFYALIICVWGTLFLKLWRRKTSTLAYKWAVDEFALTEPDRPQFYGTKKRKHPMTGNDDWYYPTIEQLRKFLLSGLTLVFMLCVVLASVIGVIVYRVFASVDYCPNLSAQACVMVTTVVSSLLNTISILILSKIYYLIARSLTDWENHRTQTAFDDALTVKLFAFEFANNYSSCFYIAFIRERLGKTGIFGLGEKYTDNCEPHGNCMSELSIQILILISCKPLPKFFNDIVLLWLKRLLKKLLQYCYKSKVYNHNGNPEEFVEIEARKPSLGDFTMEEHTEKIIQYGFLMLFASSLPLAPLIVLITNLIDIRLDAWRMLWWYRRPLATTAQGIGIWYIILQFVNICGVISNGFLIGFTSSWGRQYDVYTRLWIVVGFEHIVFALKLILDYLVQDVPSVVRLMSGKTMHDMSIMIKADRKEFEENFLKFVKVTIFNQEEKDGPNKKLLSDNKKKAKTSKRSSRFNSKYYKIKDQDGTLCLKMSYPRNFSKRPGYKTINELPMSGDSRNVSKQSDDSMA